jgi:hypothetical protein
MTMKIHGSLKHLKGLLDRHDIIGSWEEKPNGVHMMRCPCGAQLHWADGSKTVWFSGKPAAKACLTRDVAGVLHALEDR